MTHEIDFKTALDSAGLSFKGAVIADGQIHRFRPNTDKQGTQNGWYILHSYEDMALGVYGHWAKMDATKWCSKEIKHLPAQERSKIKERIEQAKQKAQAAQLEQWEQASVKAAQVFNNAGSALEDHQYLKEKQIKSHGIKQSGNALIIPISDINGKIWSLQYINIDGQKKMMWQGRKKGNFFQIGEPTDTICIAEGFATAASIHEATGYCTNVAFDAGNLKAVSNSIRERNPNKPIILCADNDAGTDGNPGLTKATEAAEAIKGHIAVPPRYIDFNDLRVAEGLDIVRDVITQALKLTETLDQAIRRLSKLNALEYEQCREEEAKALNVRVSALDKEIAKYRQAEAPAQSNEIGLRTVEPWSEAVSGEELFAEVCDAFRRYLALQQYQAEALALWTIFSYGIDISNIAPKLLVYSPEKRCGKTTLLDVLMNLIWTPLPASNISPAAIFRTIDSIDCSLVIDEADTFINNTPEISGIINSGHRKSSASVIRLVGDDHMPKSFSTWAPTVIAMIGKPADTIVDRSIMIEMRRKKPDEDIQRLILHKAEKPLGIIAQKIKRWMQDNFDALVKYESEVPQELNDRAMDNWRPLLAIADQIGGRVPETARLAAMTLSQENKDEENGSKGTILLGDVKELLSKRPLDRISTEDLMFALINMEDRPWSEWNRGKAITARQISTLLKPYKIKSKTMRFGYETKKGYEVEQFNDAFARYTPDLCVTP